MEAIADGAIEMAVMVRTLAQFAGCRKITNSTGNAAPGKSTFWIVRSTRIRNAALP